ncbi:RHS repeat-associated core domain-containing protein [Pyxidicoccus fallax]|uniref:RHS repeat-associated core domain-containing protein n=1 Tax=Pyxidicoccus fallax TaxID=394095 RepID=A0A848LD50_9BACT|nr:RHS repeat-associated core domain-containing protein [Pyxidicoccus fallax]NMO14735.1 RHS repeat-associated core domain-containing protein [Pyxidicoccus fallax]NPC77696.1 RHS repeat-associated core domain-containing protein [Pyxidicoccus fallax]
MDGTPLAGVPKPFGASPSASDSVLWWHNYLSLVTEEAGNWSVRDRGGQLYQYRPCTGVPCWASLASNNASVRHRLQRVSTGFILHSDEGERLVFEAPYVAPTGSVTRYFLTKISSSSGSTLAQLTYRQPPYASCPTGATGTAPGVPYLAEIRSPVSHLVLTYRPLQRADGGVECVIGDVSLQGSETDGGTSLTPVVAYTYASDGTAERPGHIAAAAWAGRHESYEYTSAGFVQTASDGTRVVHQYTNGVVSQSDAPGQVLQVSTTSQAVGCQPGSNCCGAAPRARAVIDLSAGRGDGLDGGSGLTQTYETLSNLGQSLEPRLYRLTESCNVAGACSPGSTQSEWTCSTPTQPGYEKARKDKRGSWEVYAYASLDGGVPGLPPQRTSVKRGASDMNGTGALEEEFFTYEQGTDGTPLLKTEEEASVLGGPGARARTTRVYAPGSNRLQATIESGWTRERQPDGTWATVQRFVGTFFHTAYVSQGDLTPDPLGRTREVHGPCLVSGEAATGCASADYRLTRYTYWPDTAPGGKRNRMHTMSVSASLASTPSVTTYANYDAWGNATEVIAADGVVTHSVFEEDRLVSSSVGTQMPTQYGYDQGRRTWVNHPEGNYTVNCYRRDTPTEACSGGVLTEAIQWTAKAADAVGASWTEKVKYEYWPDGTRKAERFLTWTGSAAETRRVVKYAADAHRRPTWEQWGEGAGAFNSVKRYDGADNLVGVGIPYNAPSAWCGSTVSSEGVPSASACATLRYDRANRLIQADEQSNSSSAAGGRACFAHDVQGNVTSVRMCPTTTACSGCTEPATFYTSDDFGQLVEVSLPDSEGPVRFQTDVTGAIVIRETEAMRRAGEYLSFSHDGLGRLVSARNVSTQPSGGSVLLYQQGYDQEGAPDASCPQPMNTHGRLRYRTDSFGTTWYQYDALGRLTGEIRVRAGTTACTGSLHDNPHTFYSYTPNGNLASVTYPHGRTVTYVHGTGAAADRVNAVDVSLHDGSGWTTTRLLSNVVWEPFGGVRGYQLNHTQGGGASGVEFSLGDNATVAPAGCSVMPPSMATSDLSGRVRALRVSSGAFISGAGAGDIFQRTFTWKADQVVRTDSCLLQATTAKTELFTYDLAVRLASGGRTSGNFTSTGGAFDRRSYWYDFRGNRSLVWEDNDGYVRPTYAPAPRSNQVLRWRSDISAIHDVEYTYEVDGRVSGKLMGRVGASGTIRPWLTFEYGTGANVATDTVFKSVSVNGLSYNYFYDAEGRRRLKVYPSGVRDEYFYDAAKQLLSDQGVDSTLPPSGYYVEDDYVWLDGRVVAMVRGRFSTGWTRASDSSLECARNGEAARCGVYFPVTDPLGKPALMLDGEGRVAGVGEYEPFGHVNRVTLRKATAMPYSNSSTTLADFGQPVGGTANPSTSVKLRALLSVVDTESSGGTPVDHASLKDSSTGTVLSAPIGGRQPGPTWTPWVQPSTGKAKLEFTANNSNCCPTPEGGLACSTATCAQYPSYPYGGVAMVGYEYRRFQTGAQPFWTPLRFPGQYHDAETDLFENWNRYYDPSSGRYLQPEPMLEDPEWSVKQAKAGTSPHAYAYANSNPLFFVDPDGLQGRSPGNGGCYFDGVEGKLVCPDGEYRDSCEHCRADCREKATNCRLKIERRSRFICDSWEKECLKTCNGGVCRPDLACRGGSR